MIPKTTREHILSLQKDVSNIKTNHLKHMHADIEKLGGKVDQIYWVLLAAVGATVLTLVKIIFN
jgi:hypothetical protein|tara:strand:- start:5 stop:196 length:192 start_codon:yes stop_codon:yes gene_type:complete